MSLKLPGSLILALTVVCVCLLAQVLELNSLFEYHRTKVASGEIWRFLSSNFAHLSWSHLLLNMGAFALLWFLFSDGANWIEWLAVIVFTSILSCLGLHLFTPELDRNVGFSGVLHGIATAGAWRIWAHDRLLSVATLVIVFFKLIYEQMFGALSDFSDIESAVVTIDAHLFGGILGLVVIILLDRRKALKRSMG